MLCLTMLILSSNKGKHSQNFPAFYQPPLDNDEATTLEGRPLYDQAQPGGADWRSILKDIQAKRRQVREKASPKGNNIDGPDAEDPKRVAEDGVPTTPDENRLDKLGPSLSSDTAASKISKRASVALLSKIKNGNGQKQQLHSARSNVQKFGRFKRQFLTSRSYFHEYPNNNRFEGDESWRSPEVFPDTPVVLRPVLDENKIVSDAAENSGNENSVLHVSSSEGPKGQMGKEKKYTQQEFSDSFSSSGSPTKADAKIFLSHDKQRETQQQLLTSKVSRSQHLQQYLSNDFGEGTERIFLLMKTGHSVQWERLPTHFFTTFTRFPNFGIYSDAASSMAGYEIIDILQDLPMSVLQDHQLGLYIEQQKTRQDHTYARPSAPKDERPWMMDKFKTIPMLQHAWKHAPDNDWFIIMDDDSYFFSDNIGRWLNMLDPNKPYYLGSAVAGLQYVFAHGGSGIILSRGLMEMAFGHEKSDEWVDEYSERTVRECCGDYVLGAFLKEKLDVGLNVAVSGKRFQSQDFTDIAFTRSNWCSDIVSFHGTYSKNIELLWEYERIRSYARRAHSSYVFSPEDAVLASKTRPSITYGDIYTDFVKPYMDTMRPMWDNGANEVEFSWAREANAGKAGIEDYLRSDGYSNKPYASVDKCRQACLAQPDCLMFRYDPYQKYCGFSTAVSFGQPKRQYQDAEIKKMLKQYGIIQPPRTNEESMYSEWRFDRIEEMRKKLACDPPSEIEEFDDGNEGWYWRAKQWSSYSLLDTVNQYK